MSVHPRPDRGGWIVRWEEGMRQRSKFFTRKRDADAYDAEIRRRRQLGGLEYLDAGRETLGDYVATSWAPAHAVPLAAKTQRYYAGLYDKHIDPYLGDLPLRSLTPETIAHWQASLLTAGASRATVRKAHTLLGAILQRATEARRIAANPQRLVKKVAADTREETRPYAPETVEQLRGLMLTLGTYRRSEFIRRRDAMLVSLLAYSGVRPEEARLLSWRDVGERTLLVASPKTKRSRPRRNVRLLAPLRSDLREWQLYLGRPAPGTPILPELDGGRWSANAYNLWTQRTWKDALAAASLNDQVPYALRHSFASLLLHEGRSVIYVARQLGHGAGLTMSTYGHVIEELEDAPRLDAESAIRRVRERLTFPMASPTSAESGADRLADA